MLDLGMAVRAWGTRDFESVLKRELAQQAEHLPLQPGLCFGNHVTSAPVTVLILSVVEADGCIHVKAGIYFESVLGGCSCADDPAPASENDEYCELLLEIDKVSATVLVTPLAED